MREAVLVRDADGNELFFGETVGECREYCTKNGITGRKGEYITLGTFDEATGYFDIEDYEEI